MAPITTRRRKFRGQAAGKAGRLIISALTKLKHKTGWTPKTITKFIQTEYGKGGGVTGRIVTQALRQGVNLGLFKVQSNKYRLKSVADRTYGELTDKGRRRRRGSRDKSGSGRKRRSRRRSRSKSKKRGGSRRRRRRR